MTRLVCDQAFVFIGTREKQLCILREILLIRVKDLRD